MGSKITQLFKILIQFSIISSCSILLLSQSAHCADSDSQSMESLQEQSKEKFKSEKTDKLLDDQKLEDDLWEMEGHSYEKENQLNQTKIKEPPPEAIKPLEEKSREKIELDKKVKRKKKFGRTEMMIDLPADSVLATLNSEPLVYVDEYNHRVVPTRGDNLFDARYKALVKIVDTKLRAAVAKQKGLENDPLVKQARKKAKEAAEAVKEANLYTNEISDAQARRYYDLHLDQFRRPDKGTRALFIVDADLNKVKTIHKRIKDGEPFTKFSYLPDPIPGSWLPKQVQEALFSLEPGQMSEVVKSPIGIFIVQLVARNSFNNFKVSVLIRNSLDESKETLKSIEEGLEFESLASENKQLNMDISKLPDKVQEVVPELDLNEISQPIATPFGYFLAKLEDRWSDAEIISAKLIRLNSEAEGIELLDRLKKGKRPGQIKERQISGKELPKEIKDTAIRLKENEYSTPIKTSLGYYIVKVEKRSRVKYFPFDIVKDKVKNMIKSKQIKEEDAYKYYQSHLSDYRKSGIGLTLDIIVSANKKEAEAIVAEIKSLNTKSTKEAFFKKYQKDLNQSVNADQLPLACQKVAENLKLGEISPVTETHLGYFVLRLNNIANPAFIDFENVKDDIKLSLVNERIKQNANANEHQVEIAFNSLEEEALDKAFLKSYLNKVDSVADDEAEQWWQDHKNEFFNTFNIDEAEFKFPNTEKEMLFKKKNVLLQRFYDLTKDLYTENNVSIFESMLIN